MTLPGQTLVTQAQYARLKGRTPLTVFIWIQKGKISPASIINRKIWVERADLDLAKSLMEQGGPSDRAWRHGVRGWLVLDVADTTPSNDRAYVQTPKPSAISFASHPPSRKLRT